MATRPQRIALSLSFVFLAAWVAVWPFTGEGDAIMHYQTSRQGLDDPACLLSAWARPLYAVIMLPAVAMGPLPAHLFAALITVGLMWQTMRLASDLGLRNAVLAGLFVIWQPLAFLLAGDTMTEIPMALGVVVAVRLWLKHRIAASCLWVSFLPLVRPEGFLVGGLWGVLLLMSVRRRAGGPSRCLARMPCLLVGTASWVVACWSFTGTPLYFVENWSWPVENYDTYGSGSLFHHVVWWPYYCGPVLLLPFLAGLAPSLGEQRMRLPWAVWGIVFATHSVLWWGGWFGALGLMRIQVSTSPTTALVCLYGWNAIEHRLREGSRARRHAVHVMGVLATITVIGYYLALPQHYRCFPLTRAARYVRTHHPDAPRIVAGDEIAHALFHLSPGDPRLVPCAWSRADNLALIAALPDGTVALWDDQRGVQWRNLTVEDFENAGYVRVHTERQRAPTEGRPLELQLMEYVVLQK